MPMPFSEIKQNICHYYGVTDIDEAKNQKRKYDNKLDYLIDSILLRDKTDYKQERSDRRSPIMIPDEDIPVVAVLIIRAVSDGEEDAIIRNWFNSNCAPCDYKNNIAVYSDLEAMLEEMRNTPDEYRGFVYGNGIRFSFRSAYRWKQHFKYILNYDQSVFLQKAYDIIDGIYDGLVALRPPIPLKVIDKEIDRLNNKIEESAEIETELEFDPELSRYAQNQSEHYTSPILGYLEEMERQIKTNVCNELLNYAYLKKKNNWKSITESVDHFPITASELQHFQMLYRVLRKEPELIIQLEKKQKKTTCLNSSMSRKKNLSTCPVILQKNLRCIGLIPVHRSLFFRKPCKFAISSVINSSVTWAYVSSVNPTFA